MEKCNDEWLKLLANLQGEEREAEEKEYCWAAESDSGFIELLLDANETVARLQGHTSQVLRRQEKGIPAILESSRRFMDVDHKVKPQVKLPK